MRTRRFTLASAALVAATLIALPAMAVTERQKRDCKADYKKYCNSYQVGTEGLRACMSRSVKKLSNMCVAALVDAGDMTKAQADRLRKTPTKKASKKTTSKKTTRKRTTRKRATTKRRTTWRPFWQR